MMNGRNLIAVLALLAVACGTGCPADTHAAPAPIADLDGVVARAMETFAVPGMAIGIVKDGQLVFAKGYGVRQLGEAGTVDTDTIFAIGSTTKAFTTAALSLLVDEGKLGWDDKVVDHLPRFRMHDPYVTRELTVRDLVTHRSGLAPGAGDLMVFPDSDFTRAEIIDSLPALRPASSFRSRFAYNNVLYMVAGEVIAKVAGSSWEDFVQRRILDRLAMTGCTVSGPKSHRGNIAGTHAVVDGKLDRVQPVDVSVIGAAGGIHCNVDGMSKWLLAQLGREALISDKQRREMWTPQTLGPVSPMLTKLHGTHFRAYGLGWNLEDFHGYQRVFHSGGVLGMVAQVMMIPELGLGVVVLENQQSAEAINAVMLHVAKAYVGTGQQDWVAMLGAGAKEGREQQAAAHAEINETLNKREKPPLPLAEYVGTYRDNWRGDAEITLKSGALELKFSRSQRLTGSLQHYRGGVFIARWRDRALDSDVFVHFTTSPDSKVGGMTLEALPGSAGELDFSDLDFQRITAAPSPETSAAATLRPQCQFPGMLREHRHACRGFGRG